MKNVCMLILVLVLGQWTAAAQGAVDGKYRSRKAGQGTADPGRSQTGRTDAQAAIDAAKARLKDATNALTKAEKALVEAQDSEPADSSAAARRELRNKERAANRAQENASLAEKRLAAAERALVLQGTANEYPEHNYFSVNSGAYLLNPYEIANTNELKNTGSDSVFFVEFAYNNVWAWNPVRRQYNWENRETAWFNPRSLFEHIDLQTKLGFYLGGGGDDPQASAIVGSGDFAAEATLTFNIYQGLFGVAPRARSEAKRSIFDETILAQSFGLVTSYGGVTDRSAFDIHHRVLTGLGYKGAFKVRGDDPGTVDKELLYSIQMGCAWIEQTQFTDPDSRTIRVRRGDIPVYKIEPGFAVESELYWRITPTSFLFVGARLYGDHDPNPWSAHIGITIAADKIAGLLGL